MEATHFAASSPFFTVFPVALQRALILVVERMARRAAQDASLFALLDVQVGSSDMFEAVYVLDAHGKITHLGFPLDKTGKEISQRRRDACGRQHGDWRGGAGQSFRVGSTH